MSDATQNCHTNGHSVNGQLDHSKYKPSTECAVENLPADFREQPSVNWWSEPVKDGYKKRPTPKYTEPITFDEALTRHSRCPEYGMGTVFGKQFKGKWKFGLDLDNCRDRATGEIAEWARNVIACMRTYAEISGSGTGVKLVGYCDKRIANFVMDFGNGVKVEVFCSYGYFALTGNQVGDHSLRDCSAEVDKFMEEWNARVGQIVDGEQEKSRAFDASRDRDPLLEPPDPDNIKGALSVLDPDKSPDPRLTDYQWWLFAGMAIHREGLSFELWAEWSTKSEHYDREECEDKWRTFDVEGIPNAKGEGRKFRSIGTYFHWAKRKGWRPKRPLYLPLDEPGNSKALANYAKGKLVHTPEFGWVGWDGKRWAKGELGHFQAQFHMEAVLDLRKERLIDSLTKKLRRSESNDATNEDKKASDIAQKALTLMKWLRTKKGIFDSIELAEKRLQGNWRDFNCKPHLFNFANGTVDLRTGELRPHDPDDMLTQMCPHDYNPNAKGEGFHKFLGSSFPNAEDRKLLQQYIGLAMYGEAHKWILVLCGPKDSGKTKFGEIVMHAFGKDDYAYKARQELLFKSQASANRDKVQLYGRRFVAMSESDDNCTLNLATFKELTGQDSITAHYLYYENMTFSPTHDLLLYTNSMPDIPEDEAAWGRIVLLVLTASFAPGKEGRVEDLKAVLEETDNVEALLAWAVAGAVEMCGRDLQVPERVKRTTQSVREDQDTLGKFIAEKCVRGDGEQALVTAFRDAYNRWHADPKRNLDGTRLTRAMKAKSIEKDKNGKYFLRLRLAAEPTAGIDDVVAAIKGLSPEDRKKLPALQSQG